MKITTQKKGKKTGKGKGKPHFTGTDQGSRKKATTRATGVAPLTGSRKKHAQPGQKGTIKKRQNPKQRSPSIPIQSRTPYRQTEVEDLKAGSGSSVPFLVSPTRIEPDDRFYHAQPHPQTSSPKENHESTEELTSQLMDYFIKGHIPTQDTFQSSSGKAHLPVDVLDTEIRDRLSDLVMVLLENEQKEKLYSYLVEYKEFIRDIMNLIE